MRRFWQTAIFGILFLAAGISAGEEVELGEVVIYDFPDSSVAGREATSSITIIDREQIEDSGEINVYDLISARVPGVLVDGGGIFSYGVGPDSAGSLNIRGLGGDPNSQVLVLLDGQPTTMGLFGHPIPDAYPLGGVERVEILRGSHSLHYGDGAMGGVVNIVTRRLEPEAGFTTQVTGGGGSTIPTRLGSLIRDRWMIYPTAPVCSDGRPRDTGRTVVFADGTATSRRAIASPKTGRRFSMAGGWTSRSKTLAR